MKIPKSFKKLSTAFLFPRDKSFIEKIKNEHEIQKQIRIIRDIYGVEKTQKIIDYVTKEAYGSTQENTKYILKLLKEYLK